MKSLTHRSISNIDGQLFFFELNRNGLLIKPLEIYVFSPDVFFFNGSDTLTIFVFENRIRIYKYDSRDNLTNSLLESTFNMELDTNVSVAGTFESALLLEIGCVAAYRMDDCLLLSLLNFDTEVILQINKVILADIADFNLHSMHLAKCSETSFYLIRVKWMSLVILDKYVWLNNHFELESSISFFANYFFQHVVQDIQVIGDFIFTLGSCNYMGQCLNVINKGFPNKFFILSFNNSYYNDIELDWRPYFWRSFKILDNFVLLNTGKRGLGVIDFQKVYMEKMNDTNSVKKEYDINLDYRNKDDDYKNLPFYDIISSENIVYLNPWKKEIVDIIVISFRFCILHLFDGVEHTIVELTNRDIIDLIRSSEETQLELLRLKEKRLEKYRSGENEISDREIYRELTGEFPDDDDQIDFGDLKDRMGL